MSVSMCRERVLLLFIAAFLTGCSGAVTRSERAEKVPTGIVRVSAFGAEHLLSPVSICSDLQGYIYVGDETNLGIHKFRPDLSYEMAFGDFGQDDSQLLTPVHLACDGFYIYVVDGRNERIARYDRDGGFSRLITPVGTDTLGSGLPVAVAVSPRGGMYVLRTRPDEVLALDEYGRFKFAFGRFGGVGGLSRASSIALGPSSEVYVCDSGNGRIAVYDSFGGYQREMKGFGNPSDVLVDNLGNIYISDLARGTVACHDRQGNFLTSISGFGSPRALALIEGTTLLVVDTENGSVVVCKTSYR